MAATNFTPISIYYSATATNVPTAGNLVAGELAINTADGKLFYKDSSGVVQVLGTKGGVGTSSNTQVLYNSSGLVVGSAGLTFDGTNLATTGTATATRFIPSGSTIATNGMFLPAANTLGFSTASTEAMRIDSSGNVGIGVSSVTANTRLEVAAAVSANANGVINVKDTTSFASGVGGRLYFSGQYNSSNAYAEFAAIQGVKENATSGNFAGALSLQVRANGAGSYTERMRIDSSGNVGIGTTSPAYKLDIAGVTRVNNGALAVQSTAGVALPSTGYGWEIYNVDSSTNYLQSYSRTGSAYMNSVYNALSHQFCISGAEKMRIDSSGNVDIGTTVSLWGKQTIYNVSDVDTQASLVVAGGTYNTGGQGGSVGFTNRNAVDSTTSPLQLGARIRSGLTSLSASQETAYLAFDTNAGSNLTERMRIESSGNVGIGTSSPSASAILDAQSTTKGVRMPNMTTTQKNAISSPAAGLMVFDTTLAKLCVYSGSAWQTITSI